MIHGIYIQAIPERQHHVKWMVKTLIEMMDPDGAVPIKPVYDPKYNPAKKRQNSPRGGFIRLLRTASDDLPSKASGHILYFQDDVTFHPQFWDVAKAVTDLDPEQMFVFYNPSHNALFKAWSDRGQCFARKKSGYWIQSMAIPVVDIGKILDFNQYIQPDYRWDDGLIQAYTTLTDQPVMILIPSLTQHLMWNDSSVGNPGSPGKNIPRYSTLFRKGFQFTLDQLEADLNGSIYFPGNGINYKHLLL